MTDFAARRTMMVDTQVRPSDVTKFPIIEAMLAIPREDFVPAGKREAAYVGENLPLAPGRVMLDPRTFAKLLDSIDPRPGERVLVVGAGLGYSAAVIARLGATVVALEEVAELAAGARTALKGAAEVVEGRLAAGSAGPFDAVLLEGAVEDLPEPLASALKDGGRIAAVFAEGALGVARIGRKIDGKVAWRDAFAASAPVLPGFERMRAFTL